MKKQDQSNNKIGVKLFSPCKVVYDYTSEGNLLCHTCVDVFKELVFFDFPSLPRSFTVFAYLNASKGSYKIGMNIIDRNGKKIIKEKMSEINILENSVIHFTTTLTNMVFQEAGTYFIQLIVDKNVIFSYDFNALKLQPPETHGTIEEILEDQETIKSSFAFITHRTCGHTKKYSLHIDPEKQIEEEKLPEEDILKCGGCGEDISIVEVKAQMKYYLGTKNLAGTFNRNLKESRILATNGFLNASLIMQVSAFEAYIRDTLIMNNKNWFSHLLDSKNELCQNIRDIKEKIINITDQMKVKSQFHDQIFLQEHSTDKSNLEEIYNYNKALKTVIWGSDEDEFGVIKVISFQQLKGQYGSFWTYKNFFGIDIRKALDRKRDKSYQHLYESFQIRHKIIHGSPIPLVENMVSADIIEKNEKIILSIRDLINRRLKTIRKNRKKFEKDIDSTLSIDLHSDKNSIDGSE